MYIYLSGKKKFVFIRCLMAFLSPKLCIDVTYEILRKYDCAAYLFCLGVGLSIVRFYTIFCKVLSCIGYIILNVYYVRAFSNQFYVERPHCYRRAPSFRHIQLQPSFPPKICARQRHFVIQGLYYIM